MRQVLMVSITSAAFGWSTLSLAQPAPPPTDGETAATDKPDATQVDPEAAKLEQAKELFRIGEELRVAGAWQQALELHLRSRALVPSAANTINAAYCYFQLARFDEALELYELALVDFGRDMESSVRQAVGAQLQKLRPRVGSIAMSANVDGIVVVDGRQRGQLPLVGPIRVLPGKRRIVIIKDGFEPFEQDVVVAAEDQLTVQASLRTLSNAGLLSVMGVEGSADTQGAELMVDGAIVGTLPWKGRLAPGRHSYQVIASDEGTAPKTVTVLDGREVNEQVELSPLGARMRIVVEPPGAAVSIDGQRVFGAPWQGRLPVGEHRLDAVLDGYQLLKKTISVSSEGLEDVVLTLKADEDHPRWQDSQLTSIEAAAAKLAADTMRSYQSVVKSENSKLAVMPLQEADETAKDKHLGTVVSELIESELTNRHQILIVKAAGEESVAVGDGLTAVQARELAEELAATALLTGSISDQKTFFIITVQVVDLDTGVIIQSSTVRVMRAELLEYASRVFVTRTKAGALYRSIVPGWGQFYNGRPHYGKGYAVLGGTLAFGGTAIVMGLMASHQNQRMHDYDIGQPATGYDGPEPDYSPVLCHDGVTFGEDAVSQYCTEQREDAQEKRDLYRAVGFASLGVAGAFWLYSIIDAGVHGENYSGVDLEQLGQRSKPKASEAGKLQAVPFFQPGGGATPTVAGGIVRVKF